MRPGLPAHQYPPRPGRRRLGRPRLSSSDDLQACGYSPDDLRNGVVDDRYFRLMRLQTDRAEEFYRRGAELFPFLEPEGRRIFGLLINVYHRLLGRIRRRPADVLVRRVRLSAWQKLRVAVPLDPAASPPDRPAMTAIAIIGGGLAGLAAAVAARQAGLEVELFEARRRLGGRAGSFRDPACGELVDHCQHVAMGCCTNLADFCRRTGIDACFRRHRRLIFIGPDGRPHRLAAAWLPRRCTCFPACSRLGYLSLADRWRIVRTLVRLAMGTLRPAAGRRRHDRRLLGSSSRASRTRPSSGSGRSCCSAPWERRSTGPRWPRRKRFSSTAFWPIAGPTSSSSPTPR